jgi:hypothetical protein
MIETAARMSSSKSRVFIFCRPYLIPDFQENVAPLANEYEFSYLTDGPWKGIRDTRQRFYALPIFEKSTAASSAQNASRHGVCPGGGVGNPKSSRDTRSDGG